MRSDCMQRYLEWASESKSETIYRDPITGLFTRDLFMLEVDREFRRSERSGEPFTIALLKLDGFTGEVKTLREVGPLIKENIFEVDLACRCAEDLFAVLLLKTSVEVAHVAGERIRQALETRFPGKLAARVGMASFPVDAADREGLLNRAAAALGQAKTEAGRQVFFFSRLTAETAENKPRVLVVDDDRRNVKLMEGHLLPQGYEVLKAYSGEEALTLLGRNEIDLMLLDIMMPGLDGYEVCKRVKAGKTTRFVPVILITALDDRQSKVKGIEAGADDFISKPANREELLARICSLVRIRELNRNLVNVESVLVSLANAVEAKDNYTLGHTLRVANLAEALGTRLQMTKKEIFALRQGAIMHDVGKIGISEDILNKPGKLEPDEWEAMKAHPEIGYRICLPMKSNLGLALDVIRHHHEKLDGSSYPDGLKGDEISLAARIMCVVDIYDALVTDRPYRKAMPKAKAVGILRDEVSLGKLDPRVVNELEDLVG